MACVFVCWKAAAPEGLGILPPSLRAQSGYALQEGIAVVPQGPGSLPQAHTSKTPIRKGRHTPAEHGMKSLRGQKACAGWGKAGVSVQVEPETPGTLAQQMAQPLFTAWLGQRNARE